MDSQGIKDVIHGMGARARAAANALAVLDTEKKNDILRAMADGLREQAESIINANAKDIIAGEENDRVGMLRCVLWFILRRILRRLRVILLHQRCRRAGILAIQQQNRNRLVHLDLVGTGFK